MPLPTVRCCSWCPVAITVLHGPISCANRESSIYGGSFTLQCSQGHLGVAAWRGLGPHWCRYSVTTFTSGANDDSKCSFSTLPHLCSFFFTKSFTLANISKLYLQLPKLVSFHFSHLFLSSIHFLRIMHEKYKLSEAIIAAHNVLGEMNSYGRSEATQRGSLLFGPVRKQKGWPSL